MRTRLQRFGRGWSWLRGVRAAVLTFAAGVVFLALFGGELEEAYGLGMLFHLRGQLPAPSDVVAVAINRASAENLGLPFPPPWPRTVHADLIRALDAHG